MANDPNRDFLPVKEISDKGCDNIDPHVVSRLKRPELEDRFITLYEENNELKKLANTLDGKVKKLGTKLLRVINDKKAAQPLYLKRAADIGLYDELQLKVVELENENYALKDKNAVLRQQLASHSKQHMAAHRSPVQIHRALRTPRLSQRQTSVCNIVEETYTPTNRQLTDLQLRDAEVHIAGLNDEIKLLQSQVDSLQKELEKSAIGNKKAQVGENIEFIKLRRQNKQLHTQLRVAELNQKALQQDIARLQKESEDAVQIVAEKQNEIIAMQSKLDEAGILELEFQELKEANADLLSERDLLKERCDALIKAIGQKSDLEVHEDLRRQLADVKQESTLLRQELDLIRIQNLQGSLMPLAAKRQAEDAYTQTETKIERQMTMEIALQTSQPSAYDFLQQLTESKKIGQNVTEAESEASVTVNGYGLVNFHSPSVPQPSDNEALSALGSVSLAHKLVPMAVQQELSDAADLVNLQRELEWVRDMLRAQTQRCDAQENEIIRLQQEIKLNEARYRDVFQQRDLFFRLLDKESQMLRKSSIARLPDSDQESGECPSGRTYTNIQGTYTKSSPIKLSSQVVTPSEVTLNEAACNLNGGMSSASTLDQTQLLSPHMTEVPTPLPRTRVSSAKAVENVVHTPEIQVSILWLRLEADSGLLSDTSVKALYVDFTFLNKNSDDYETPQALPKPSDPYTKSVYNFTAVVPWTEDLLPELHRIKELGAEGDFILFNIVSEPLDDGTHNEIQCPVVGISRLGFHQFTLAEPDEELQIPIYGMGKDKKFCGTLGIKLNVPASIFRELQQC